MKTSIFAIAAALLLIGAGALAYVVLTSDPESQPEVTPTPSEEPGEEDMQVIGYVGCSNTWQKIEGYQMAGGEQFWTADPRYGGGHLSAWADKLPQGGHWKWFDEHLEEHPDTNKIWWELCIRESETPSYDDASRVLAGIRERLPDATIYVSALPEFADAECSLTGSTGVETSNNLLAELLDKNPDLVAGPSLSDMTSDKTLADRCHITTDARKNYGEELMGFFD